MQPPPTRFDKHPVEPNKGGGLLFVRPSIAPTMEIDLLSSLSFRKCLNLPIIRRYRLPLFLSSLW